MRNRNIGFGIFLLFIGVILLLINFGIIGWSIFDALSEFWPAILIVIGVNIIFKHNEIVKAVVWILFLAALIAYSFYYKGKPGTLPKGNDWARGRGINIEERVDAPHSGFQYDIDGASVTLFSGRGNVVPD